MTSWNIRLLFGKVSLEKFSDIRLYVKRSLCGRKYTDEYTVDQFQHFLTLICFSNDKELF